jgi:hypothetical protein
VSTRDDLASLDLALPDVVAGTHFGVPSYKANSKNFIGVGRDGAGATFALADEDAAELRSAGWPSTRFAERAILSASASS